MNNWSGRCYACGDDCDTYVRVWEAPSSRPPKHFCQLCWDQKYKVIYNGTGELVRRSAIDRMVAILVLSVLVLTIAIYKVIEKYQGYKDESVKTYEAPNP